MLERRTSRLQTHHDLLHNGPTISLQDLLHDPVMAGHVDGIHFVANLSSFSSLLLEPTPLDWALAHHSINLTKLIHSSVALPKT